MKVVFGNVWDYPADYICIPTNGYVKSNGECVMGRGVALQAVRRFPGIAKMIGRELLRNGNHFAIIDTRYCIFPVKHHWREKADLDLITRSTKELALVASRNPEQIYVLPRPGCGNGGRTWEEVKPLLKDLPNNVHVIDLEGTP